jgi:hypothetical protein
MAASCVKLVPAIIYNGSAVPISISYAMQRYQSVGGEKISCMLDAAGGQQPRVRQGKPKGNVWSGERWSDIEGRRMNREDCQTEFELAPDHSAIVYTNGTCAGFEKSGNGVQLLSTLEYLRIRTKDGELEFAGRATAEQFRRVGSRFCLFEIR